LLHSGVEFRMGAIRGGRAASRGTKEAGETYKKQFSFEWVACHEPHVPRQGIRLGVGLQLSIGEIYAKIVQPTFGDKKSMISIY